MNKKLLIVSVIVIAGVVALYLLFRRKPSGDVWVGNVVSASYPEGVVNESYSQPTRQLIYIDVTGSMTPYYVKDKRNSVVDALSAVLTLIDRDSCRVRFLNDSQVVKKRYANDILQRAYNNNDNRLKQVTAFENMFKDAVDSVSNTPGTIVYLITDGILSLNKKDNNMEYYLNELKSQITKSLSQGCSNVACGIYRYLGDFNGTYINCLEKTVMNQRLQRPFYIIAFGNKEQIRWLARQQNDKLGNPKGKLFIGTHDFKGHTQAVLSNPPIRHLEKPGEAVTLVLSLPECMKNEIDITKCRVTGVANPYKVEKEISNGNLNIILPQDCGFCIDTSGLVTIDVSMPNEITGEWTKEWSTDNDTLGPDSISTFGLASLINGIVAGLQPDSVFFKTTFQYRLK